MTIDSLEYLTKFAVSRCLRLIQNLPSFTKLYCLECPKTAILIIPTIYLGPVYGLLRFDFKYTSLATAAASLQDLYAKHQCVDFSTVEDHCSVEYVQNLLTYHSTAWNNHDCCSSNRLVP